MGASATPTGPAPSGLSQSSLSQAEPLVPCAGLGLPTDLAHHYFWSGYWDGPIDGWIYVRGQFYHFDSLGDALALNHRIYGVYYVPKSVRAAHMLRHRSFALQVGRHTGRKPGEPRRFFSEAAKPNWKVWYLANSKPLPPIERKMMVGITRLRDGVVHWLDKPEHFSREWQYLDSDEDEEDTPATAKPGRPNTV